MPGSDTVFREFLRRHTVVYPLIIPALLLAGAGELSSQSGSATAGPETGYPINPETAPRPVATAVRADEPIRVDGRLDEAAWQKAEVIGNFIQSQPDVGYPATEVTEVRILFDDRALYIGAVCHDSDTKGFVIRSLERDFPGESTRDSDVFSVTLDTFLDRRNSFMWLVNPLGGYRDDQTFNDSRQLDSAWDGLVNIRTRVEESLWTVEMEIPWTTLRFDPSRGEQVWGLNLLRRVRRKNEDSYWAPLDRRDPVHRMSKAGTLRFEGMRAKTGLNLRVKPYGLVRQSPGDVTDEDRFGGPWDVGLDVKYGVTTGLTLDGTLNTDFSQVEVDQQRVNLTRFPLFFPEKREFFVENSGSFIFGDVTERNYRMGTSLSDFTLFHSRRIGLTSGGQPIPIVGGARLSGRMGRTELGFLNMQTERLGEVPPENFTVVRIRQNVTEGSELGGMLINRQATDGSGVFNRSYGADLNIRVLGSMIINSYLAATQTPVDEGSNTAGRVSVAWRDRLWDVSAMYKQVGDDFRPGVGFVRRTDIRHSYATFGAHPRPGLPWLFELNPYAEFHYITNLESVLETRESTLGLVFDMLSAGDLTLSSSDYFERLSARFRVTPDVTIPAGDYQFRESMVSYASNKARKFSGGVSFTDGGYYNGTRTSVGVDADWRVSPHLAVQVSVDHNSVSLPDASFTADVYGARVDYNHSTRVLSSAYIQYNESTGELVSNVRFNFIYRPLSDIFVVFNERRDVNLGLVLDRMLTFKVTRLFAF